MPRRSAGGVSSIDRGGTFTDVIGRRPDGELVTPSSCSPKTRSVIATLRFRAFAKLFQLAADAPIPAERIDAVKMGTTVATNALLERKGDRTVLLITRGFADALRIAYQHRPKLFVRHIELPSLLCEEVVEVDERIGADGSVVREPGSDGGGEVATRRLCSAVSAAARSC